MSLAERALVPWGAGLPGEVVETGPPEGGSFLAVPGPLRKPARTSLAPSISAGGRWCARAVAGDGAALPLVVFEGPRSVWLASSPLDVCARDGGGFWAIHSGQVVLHDAEGGAVRSEPVGAVLLVSAADDGVWAVTLDEAVRLDGGGRVAERVEWRGGTRSAPAAGGGLAAPLDGSVEVLGGSRVSVDLGPHERLLAVAEDAVLTATGGSVRRHAAGSVDEVPLQAAGLSEQGVPWISGRASPTAVELRSDGTVERFELGESAPAQGALRVVDADTLTVVGSADAWRLRGGEHFMLDESSYRDSVFPTAWELGTVTGTPAGTVLVSASGPPGAALLELRW